MIDEDDINSLWTDFKNNLFIKTQIRKLNLSLETVERNSSLDKNCVDYLLLHRLMFLIYSLIFKQPQVQSPLSEVGRQDE